MGGERRLLITYIQGDETYSAPTLYIYTLHAVNTKAFHGLVFWAGNVAVKRVLTKEPSNKVTI